MVIHHGDLKTNLLVRRPLGPRAASPFVGRDNELRGLVTRLDRAAEGKGSTIFLTGQPGIGKTRLVREALAVARKHGFRVLEGRAFPLETGLAYAPVVDAFDLLIRSFDPVRLAALVNDLPDLGRLFGGLEFFAPAIPLEGLGDPALQKTRLFGAMSRLLKRLAKEAPVALFVDDVHWADPASIDLLHYIARGLANQPVLLLATYGFGTLDASQGVQALIVSLEREGLAQEIVVPPLSSTAVNQLVRGILDGEPPGDLLDLIDKRARGTPLFIESLLASLVDSGDLARIPSENDGWILNAEPSVDLPPSIRRLILDRLRRLPPGDRRILELLVTTQVGLTGRKV
ncbi:MAG: DUF2791 family P-loop domain-containing protein [Dehalococcoidia bacterium]|nr:DUF2791 family P-loop domain-containing protein [Dehalococcoidia bacterium]